MNTTPKQQDGEGITAENGTRPSLEQTVMGVPPPPASGVAPASTVQPIPAVATSDDAPAAPPDAPPAPAVVPVVAEPEMLDELPGAPPAALPAAALAPAALAPAEVGASDGGGSAIVAAPTISVAPVAAAAAASSAIVAAPEPTVEPQRAPEREAAVDATLPLARSVPVVPRLVPRSARPSPPARPAEDALQHTALSADYLRAARDAALSQLSGDITPRAPTAAAFDPEQEAFAGRVTPRAPVPAPDPEPQAFAGHVTPRAPVPAPDPEPQAFAGHVTPRAPVPTPAPDPEPQAFAGHVTPRAPLAATAYDRASPPPATPWMERAPGEATPSTTGTRPSMAPPFPEPASPPTERAAPTGTRGFEPVPVLRAPLAESLSGAFGPIAELGGPRHQPPSRRSPSRRRDAAGRWLLLASVALATVGVVTFGTRVWDRYRATSERKGAEQAADVAASAARHALPEERAVAGSPPTSRALMANRPAPEPSDGRVRVISATGVPVTTPTGAEASATGTSPESQLAATAGRHVLSGNFAEALPLYRQLERSWPENSAYAAMSRLLEKKVGTLNDTRTVTPAAPSP